MYIIEIIVDPSNVVPDLMESDFPNKKVLICLLPFNGNEIIYAGLMLVHTLPLSHVTEYSIYGVHNIESDRQTIVAWTNCNSHISAMDCILKADEALRQGSFDPMFYTIENIDDMNRLVSSKELCNQSFLDTLTRLIVTLELPYGRD